jgi:membrane protease YdiL (CAAX protease family)
VRWFKRTVGWTGRQFDAVDDENRALTRGGLPDRQTAVVLITVVIVLGFMQYVARSADVQVALSEVIMLDFGLADGLDIVQRDNRAAFLENLVWVTGSFVGYIVIPLLVIRFVLRRPLSDFGLRPAGYFGHLPLVALMYLVVVSGVVLVGFTDAFQDKYPFYRDPESIRALVLWEVMYGFQFLGLELFFRGFMLHGLKHRYGTAALWIMLLPYVMIHFTKPVLEAAGAVVAGLVLGLLSLRTRSIWGGATIHVAVAWTMDLLVLGLTGWFALHLGS